MPLLSADEIRDLLIESADLEFYDHKAHELHYAFGDYEPAEGDRKARPGGDWRTQGGRFPIYAGPRSQWLTEGRSKRIRNNQFIGLSRVRQADVLPHFPGVDESDGEVRAAFFRARSNGFGGFGANWDTEYDQVFLEGDSLGTSFLHLGVRQNPATKRDYTCARYSSILRTLWDPSQASLAEARWICFVKHVPWLDAKARYGKKADEHRATSGERGACGVQNFVRVFEFYSIDFAGREATYCEILGDIDSPTVLKRGKNPFGSFLPFAEYTHYNAPLATRASGRIEAQANIQEAINRLEETFDAAIKTPGFTVLDLSLIEPDDVARLQAGEVLPYVRAKASFDLVSNRPAVIPIPGMILHESINSRYGILVNELTAASATTDFDRGTQLEGRRTAREVNAIDQRSQAQGLWPVKQIAKFYAKTARVAVRIGAEHDDDPLLLRYQGADLMFNEGDMMLKPFLIHDSDVTIDEESLMYADSVSKMQAKVAFLYSAKAPLVQMQAYPADRFARDVLEAMGEDYDEIAQGPDAQAAPGMPGMPGDPNAQPQAMGAAPLDPQMAQVGAGVGQNPAGSLAA